MQVLAGMVVVHNGYKTTVLVQTECEYETEFVRIKFFALKNELLTLSNRRLHKRAVNLPKLFFLSAYISQLFTCSVYVCHNFIYHNDCSKNTKQDNISEKV